MPWVEETLRHDQFLDDLFYKVFRRFEDERGNKWWQNFNTVAEKVDLYKISFEKGLFVKGKDGYKVPEGSKEGNICITRHVIFRRWDNQLLGFAQSTGTVKVDTSELPKEKKELFKGFVQMYKDLIQYTTLYAYTVDEYTGFTHALTTEGKAAPITVMYEDAGSGVFNSSLDIEYHSDDEFYPNMMQSPIVTMNLKGDTNEHIAKIGKLNYRANTNWWGDSLVQLKGVFDETSCFFTLKVDSAPGWEDNLVTLVPFFFGNLVREDTPRTSTPIALLGGRQVGKFFDYDNVETVTDTLQPTTRNYVEHPSNGIESIMIKKSKYGARYQKHYLKWQAPPHLMPPTREEIRKVKEAEGTEKEEEMARKYPRAWNYLRYGYYQYSFHPSRYSEDMKVSRAYVVHPEDGTLGFIPNIILAPLINLSEGTILKKPNWCADCAEAKYQPESPIEVPITPWDPSEDNGVGAGVEKQSITFMCDESSNEDTAYWIPTSYTQEFFSDKDKGLGRNMDNRFWEGRNDLLEVLQKEHNGFNYALSQVEEVTAYHHNLWKAIRLNKEGKLKQIEETWVQFKENGSEEFKCLNTFEKASLYSSLILNKPVLFFPPSQPYLEGDILDSMLAEMKRVPTDIYDWVEFNQIYEGSGRVGAFTTDKRVMVRFSNGKAENILKTFKSAINFEPTLLQYSQKSIKANRPHDYIKTGDGFGEQVEGGYSEYFIKEIPDERVPETIATETAIHEMGHAISAHAEDVLGEELHLRSEWLAISGWEEKTDGTFKELYKTNPGTTADNGKLAPVSDYGCFGPAEDFAEAFMFYVINRPFLREKFYAKFKYIEEKLSEMGMNADI